MTEVSINLVGASPFYAEWRQEFIIDLETSFPGRVVDHGNEIQVVAGRQSSQITVDKNQSNINVHVNPTYQRGGGGGAFIGTCLFLMAILFFFSAWRFAFMPFFFVSPFWIILFFVIFATPVGGHYHGSLVGPILRLARNAWERVMLRNKSTIGALATNKEVTAKIEVEHPTNPPSPGPNLEINPESPMKKVADDSRPPDEAYLLSPAAGEAARTPAMTKKADEDAKLKEAAAMFCPYCGARRQVGARFCSNCGTALVSHGTES